MLQIIERSQKTPHGATSGPIFGRWIHRRGGHSAKQSEDRKAYSQALFPVKPNPPLGIGDLNLALATRVLDAIPHAQGGSRRIVTLSRSIGEEGITRLIDGASHLAVSRHLGDKLLRPVAL